MMAELEKIKIESDANKSAALTYEWAARTLRRMKRASPVSLLVTLEYLNMVVREEFTFDDCLTMDYRLSQKFADTDDYWIGVQAACDRNRSAIWSYKSVDKVPAEVVRNYFLPFDDPRKEFRAIYSRPKEQQKDWARYYNDFIAELTTPVPKPRIWQDDGGLYLGRIPPGTSTLSTEQILDIPTWQEIRDSLDIWEDLCYRLDFSLRHHRRAGYIPELAKRFVKEILGDAYTQIRKFVTKSTNIPATYLDLGSVILDSMQPILKSARVKGSPDEWLPAAKDIIPIIGENMHKLNSLLRPLKIPDSFQEEAFEMGIAAYDRGLAEDVDYVSV